MATSEHLVGRADELGSFETALAQLDRGLPAAILLAGEPGIGKTRLLSELAARADRLGCLVLAGSASELERDLPFWVFVDALDEYVRGLDPRQVASLDDDVRTELAHIFPSLRPAGGGEDAALQSERYRTHRAVRALLEQLAATRPVVLVLDDLHWADSGSVELVGALLHRPPSAAVLLGLAIRPRQIPERLAVSFGRAGRAGTLVSIELGALSRSEASELLGDLDDGAQAELLYEESGGNPFYLEQLARSLALSDRSATATAAPSLSGLDVPSTVVAALTQELALLTESARLVLEGASVAGDPFEPELAAAAAATSEQAAMEALDELLRFGLVRATDVPRRFRFRHPLVRRAVYDAAPGGWRLGAHERVVAALETRGASVTARAQHVALSARQGDMAAVAVLREAGEAAAQRAPESAARWFEGALRLLPDSAPPEERVGLLLAQAGSLGATGQFAESRAALLESLTIAPEESIALRVRLTVACAGIEQVLGRHREAHARLEGALAELQDPDSPEAVALMIQLSIDALYGHRFEAMRDWADRAVTAAVPLGDRTLVATALAARASGSALAGTAAEAQAHRLEAAELVDQLSDEEVARRLDALTQLATAEMYHDQFEGAARHAQRALTLGRATGQGDHFPLIYPSLGTALWIQGRMQESAEVLDGAVEAARLVGDVQGLAWNLLNRAMAALASGDSDLALAIAEESFALAGTLDESPVTAWAAVALATALLDKGEAGRATELMLASAGGDELRSIGGGWRAWCLEVLTRALLQAGRRADAERAAAAAQACADSVGLRMAAGMAALAAAALDLDADEPARAAERALDAAAALEEAGDVADAAKARLLAGRALARALEPDRAAAELEQAAIAFESFGSVRYRAEAERELRKLGRRIHRRTQAGSADGSGVASLTERELEVARLVVDRKTNPEIAAALFLSQKTVETHLRNIFRKVGVSSRVELARAVERADAETTLAP